MTNMGHAAVMVIVLGIGFALGVIANHNPPRVVAADPTPTRITTYVDGTGARSNDAGLVRLNEPVYMIAGGRSSDGLSHALKVDDQGRVFCAPQ